MRRATVLICDDHPMVSQGLRGLLRSNFVSVGIVNDGRELVTTLERAKPDVLLLDVSMPHINGLELLPQVREAFPALKVIIVTMHVDRALADLAISAGAHGFIPKEATADELNGAIEHVLSETKPFISPHIPRRSFRDKAAIQHPELDRLTPRHRQILRMIGDGKSSQEMAELLGVSPRTVEFHRASIRKALGLTNEWGLIRFAIMMRVSEGEGDDETPDDSPPEEND